MVAVEWDLETKVVDMVVKEEAMVATMKGEMWVEVTAMWEIIANSNKQRCWGGAYGAGYGSVVDTVTEGRVKTAETIIALSRRARSFQESCMLLCTVVSGGTVCHRRGEDPLSETSLQPKQETLFGLS